MDATAVSIITSGITGTLAFGGIALQVRASINKNRTDSDIAVKNADASAASRVDERIWKYIDQLEADRDAVRELADKATVRLETTLADLRADHLGLQAIYEQAFARLEVLEQQRVKDQGHIQELQSQLLLLKGS